ncbi:hypothetical protein L1049_022858 [Liquidambar formosana]|uniref:Uncharacterized protein n=1 Tax=Liquidambar formosana TaxID=63359 RepID=A0AAP0WQV1_LIQFO
MSLQCVTFPSGPLPCNSAKKQSLIIYKDLLSFPQAHPKSCSSIRLRLGLEDVAQIAHNKVLIAAAVSAAIGQLSKPFTSSIFYGKISISRRPFRLEASLQPIPLGFTDSIFGMTVVYACLVMYDAQGVRREVGNHARTLNGILLPKTKVNSISSKEMDDLLDSKPGRSSSLDSESLGPLLSEETISSHTPKPAPVLVRSANGARQVLMSSGVEEGSENATRSPTTLKEAIGHTEVEVIAGAMLGFFVSLAVYTIM